MECNKCNVNVVKEDLIVCSECKNSVHYLCQSISEKNFRKMSTEKKSKWKCISCKTTTIEPAVVIEAVKGGEGSAAVIEPAKGGEGSAIAQPTGGALSQLDLEAISTIVKQIIQSQLSPTFLRDFQDMKSSIEFVSDEFDKFKQELKDCNEELKIVKSENENLKADISSLKKQIADFEMYTRRDNVIVTGLPESPKESVFEIFKNISTAIGSPLTGKDLSAAHRVPSRTKDGIKPIILKFMRREDKVTWLSEFKKKALEDKSEPGISTKTVSRFLPVGRISAYQHLSPAVSMLLKDTKKLAEEKNYRYVWSRDGKIFVRKTETSPALLIRSKDDYNKL